MSAGNDGIKHGKVPHFLGNDFLLNSINAHRKERFIEPHPFTKIGYAAEWEKVLKQFFGHLYSYYFVLFRDVESKIKTALPVFAIQKLTDNKLTNIPFAIVCDPPI